MSESSRPPDGVNFSTSPNTRVSPADEYTHPVEAAANFNESMYFNVFDPRTEVGGWFRIGNRPNEGYAEMTCCVYRPDGSVGFIYGRPAIDGNERFEAAGMRFEVLEPLEHLRVSYEGSLLDLADPLAMRDPKAAFTRSPRTGCRIDLSYRALAPAFGGEPEPRDDGEAGLGAQFARAHYEQHVGARGTISVGDEEWQIDGYGLRDHSWGPRYWQALASYRWLTCNAGERDGFMVAIVAGHDGDEVRSGVLLCNGAYSAIADARLETSYTDAGDHEQLRCTAKVADGRELEIHGSVRSLIPLRNRREGMTTTIGEGLTEYTWTGDDGARLTGYGMAEYLDQT